MTDQRVIFRGTNKNREWAYAKLVGFSHDTRWPCTLIHVSNRKKTSGLLLDPGNVAGFRFAFTLAMAEHAGDRQGFVAHLEHLLDDHKETSPPQPLPAAPEDAPTPIGAIAGVAVASILGLLVVVGLLFPERPSQEGLGTAASASPAIGRPPGKTASKPTKTPTKKPKQLCGAPDNPFGYTFCGGALINNPEPAVCSYFTCIDHFHEGKGYLVQCRDGEYSMSGGRRGACSYHGGVLRPLYQKPAG